MYNISMFTTLDTFLQPSPLTEAFQIFFFGLVTSLILYLFIGWIFRFTGIEKLLHKLLGHSARIGRDPLPKALWKYLSVFIFLLFLRTAVERTGYTEVEKFLDSLVDYVPFLFWAVFISFLGIQASKTFHSIVYNAVHFENVKTAAVVANITRVLFLFFVFTIVIGLINAGPVEIIPEYLVRSVLIGFVASASLAFGLAFGLGGKDAATQILHEYLHKKEEEQKNLKK